MKQIITKLCLGITIIIVSISSALANHSAILSEHHTALHPMNSSHIQIGLSWLYLEPSGGPTDFASMQTGPENNRTFKSINTNPDYQSAYRLLLGYYYAPTRTEGIIDYTRFDHDYSKTASANNGLFPVDAFDGANIVADRATGNTDYDYYAVNAAIRQAFQPLHWYVIKLIGGLHFVSLDTVLRARYTLAGTNRVAPHRIESDYDGIGPMLGVFNQVLLGKGVSISAEGDFALVVGDNDMSSRSSNPTDPNNVIRHHNSDSDADNLVPYADLKFALGKQFNLSHTTALTGKIGYEAIYYNDIYQRSSGPTGRTSAQKSIQFNGLFVGLDLYVA